MAKKRKQLKKKRLGFLLKYSILFFTISCGIYFSVHYIDIFFASLNNSIPKIIGFSIDHINISGANKKTQKLIYENIGILKGDSIFKLPAQEIFFNVSKVNWIKSVSIQKILPNTINIKVKERKPIAIFQHDQDSDLIDEDGVFIEKIKNRISGIPIISGENANVNVKYILGLIAKYNDLQDNLESLTYIRERRWNIVVRSVKVLLPETEIENALDVLSIIMKTEKINKNTVSQIDLRIPGNAVLSKLKLSNTNNIL